MATGNIMVEMNAANKNESIVIPIICRRSSSIGIDNIKLEAKAIVAKIKLIIITFLSPIFLERLLKTKNDVHIKILHQMLINKFHDAANLDQFDRKIREIEKIL